LGTAAIVLVFVVFMLIQREDLRNRLIHLVGSPRLNVTTQAGRCRSSGESVLVMQLIINSLGSSSESACSSLAFRTRCCGASWRNPEVRAVHRPWIAASVPVALSWRSLTADQAVPRARLFVIMSWCPTTF
jgi:hypothetical protein